MKTPSIVETHRHNKKLTKKNALRNVLVGAYMNAGASVSVTRVHPSASQGKVQPSFCSLLHHGSVYKPVNGNPIWKRTDRREQELKIPHQYSTAPDISSWGNWRRTQATPHCACSLLDFYFGRYRIDFTLWVGISRIHHSVSTLEIINITKRFRAGKTFCFV